MPLPLTARFWKRLAADQRGAYMVEFAIIAPVVITLVLGTIDLGYLSYVRATLESVTRDAARQAITRTSGCMIDRSSTIEDIVKDSMKTFIDGGTPVSVTVRSYRGGFESVGQPEPLINDVNGNGQYDEGDSYEDINGDGEWSPDQGTLGDLGGPGDVVVYTTNFQAQTLFLGLPLMFSQDIVNMRASTVVRNEPYTCDE
ncbi:TadE/TadG family type IV pilus assembly protein [Parapedomonas caeni]|jgi:Flp pilus assembly pilin Flp